MKKCQSCGYENTDIMNYCLECGGALANQPQMVIPLNSLGEQDIQKPSDQVTEEYEKETFVNNQFGVQQSVPTYLAQQPKKRSNTKIFLAVGGGLFVLFMLVGVGIAGIFIFALQNQSQPNPKPRPIVSKTPIKNDDDLPIPPTPEPDETPVSTPIVDNTPEPDNDTITFPTPTSPTKRGNYNVRPVTGWQLSEIKTVPSQNFQVQASGLIKLEGINKNVGIQGINGYEDRRIIKEFKTGALLMRTHYPDGSHSPIQPVALGQYWVNEPEETGKIEFLVNDSFPESNGGSFSIKVTDLGIPKN